jgi:hypothetical protein
VSWLWSTLRELLWAVVRRLLGAPALPRPGRLPDVRLVGVSVMRAKYLQHLPELPYVPAAARISGCTLYTRYGETVTVQDLPRDATVAEFTVPTGTECQNSLRYVDALGNESAERWGAVFLSASPEDPLPTPELLLAPRFVGFVADEEPAPA